MAQENGTDGPPERKLAEYREVDLADAEANARLERDSREPAQRCTEMIMDLEAIRQMLASGKPVPERFLATVNRMYEAYVNRPAGEWGPIMAIGEALRVGALTYDGKGAPGTNPGQWPEEAFTSFYFTLSMKWPELQKDVGPETKRLALDAIMVWNRGPGAPRAGDRAIPKKWVAYAVLVASLGYGDVDPDALRDEYRRQQQNGGKGRP